MHFTPPSSELYCKRAAKSIKALVKHSRRETQIPRIKWFSSETGCWILLRKNLLRLLKWTWIRMNRTVAISSHELSASKWRPKNQTFQVSPGTASVYTKLSWNLKSSCIFDATWSEFGLGFRVRVPRTKAWDQTLGEISWTRKWHPCIEFELHPVSCA